MIFNSLPFLVFVAIFIPLYFALKGRARLLLALANSRPELDSAVWKD